MAWNLGCCLLNTLDAKIIVAKAKEDPILYTSKLAKVVSTLHELYIVDSIKAWIIGLNSRTTKPKTKSLYTHSHIKQQKLDKF